MTTMLQAGGFGRFERSFRDLDAEIHLMAGAEREDADVTPRRALPLLDRLFGRRTPEAAASPA